MINRENIIITDDNFDEEFEKICNENGYPYGCDVKFVDSLFKGFTKSDNKYVKVIIEPNIAIDCSSAIENYQIAFRFANGFMIFTERSSLYD